MFLEKKSPKMTKSKNVKFDTKIKKRIIVRYYFDSINTFRDTSNRNFSKKKLKNALNILNKCINNAIKCYKMLFRDVYDFEGFSYVAKT